MNSRQLEKYLAALKGLLSEVLLSAGNGKGGPVSLQPGPGSAHSSVSIPGAVCLTRVWEGRFEWRFVFLLCTRENVFSCECRVYPLPHNPRSPSLTTEQRGLGRLLVPKEPNSPARAISRPSRWLRPVSQTPAWQRAPTNDNNPPTPLCSRFIHSLPKHH